MSFPGLHITFYSRLPQPLYDLTNKRCQNGIPWGEEWGEEEEKAFTELRQAVIKATLEPIGMIDCIHPFVLLTDASDYEFAGILQQEGDDRLRPVAFTSAKLTPTQSGIGHNRSKLTLGGLALCPSLNYRLTIIDDAAVYFCVIIVLFSTFIQYIVIEKERVEPLLSVGVAADDVYL